MSRGAWDRCAKAEQVETCVFALGVPTTKAGFHACAKQKPGSIAAGGEFGWKNYENQVVQPLARMEKTYNRFHVDVKRDLTLNEFGDLFDESRYSVVVLFTHWGRDVVEFADGMASIADTAERVPEDFAGILDLCVCHPTALVDRLQKRCPNTVIKFLDGIPAAATGRMTAEYWLNFYALLFEAMRQDRLSYLRALEKVVFLLLSSVSQKGTGK